VLRSTRTVRVIRGTLGRIPPQTPPNRHIATRRYTLAKLFSYVTTMLKQLAMGMG
jgi:hypothetical protein